MGNPSHTLTSQMSRLQEPLVRLGEILALANFHELGSGA